MRIEEEKKAKQAAEEAEAARAEAAKKKAEEEEQKDGAQAEGQPAEAQIPTNTAQAAKEIAERLAKQTQEAAAKAAADKEAQTAANQANKEAEAALMAQQSQLQQQQMLWDPQQQLMQQQMQMADPTQQVYGQDPAMMQQAMLQQQALMQAYGMACGGCAMGMDPTAYAAAMGSPFAAQQAVYMQAGSGKQYGTVKVFNPDKGFGFVSCSSVQGDVFFLRSELPPELQALVEERRIVGQPVAFDLSLGKDTRHRATNMQACTMEMVHAAMQMAPQPQGTAVEGTIKSYSDRHGYGFISSPSLNRDAQFKTGELTADLQAIGTNLIGRNISCHVHALSDGKLKATHVSLKTGMGMSMGCGGQGCGQTHRGYVTMFDPVSRLGVISAPGVPEVHFCETLGQNLAPGAEVNFALQMLPDGSVQGTDVIAGPPAPSLGNGLVSGTQTAGLVKNYNDLRGFGFISIPGGSQDVYFQRRDMDDASQTLLTWVGGQGLTGCTANLRLEALSDGRWHARSITLSEAGLNLWDGAALAGVVKAYFPAKAIGFLNVPASQAIDFLFQEADLASDLQNRLQQAGPSGLQGALCWFRLRAQPDGRWQAKEVCLSGDGKMVGGAEATNNHKSAPRAFLKVEKKIIPGAELLGTLKAWNFERGYGFIGVEGQSSDVYFQPFDLTESLKQQFDLVGPESCGILPGAVLHFWLQQMPGTGRLRGRDVSVAPPGAPPSDGFTVEAAVNTARQVAEEELAQYHAQLERQSVDVVFDGAELNGIIKTFNPGGDGKGFGFINADGDTSDLYFQTKDFRPEDQRQLAEPGFRLVGQRVWFWIEMLDGGRTGKWRAHDLSFSSEGGKRPADYTPADQSAAKRARMDGAPGPGRFFGMVKSFADDLGALNTSGLADDVAFSKDELPPGVSSVQPGQQVEFELVVEEAKISAKNIVLM